MNKYLLVILTLIACSKESNREIETKKCYSCEISGFNGTPGWKQDVCTNRIDTFQFKNSQGSTMPSQCVPK